MSRQTLEFKHASLMCMVTVAGDKKVDFLNSYEDFNLSLPEAERLSKVMGLSSRYIVSGEETTSDLCFDAAKKLISGTSLSESDINGLIFVSQTPDFSTPATAISLQHRLGISTCSI